MATKTSTKTKTTSADFWRDLCAPRCSCGGLMREGTLVSVHGRGIIPVWHCVRCEHNWTRDDATVGGAK